MVYRDVAGLVIHFSFHQPQSSLLNCNLHCHICRCVEARAPAVLWGREESTASSADTTLASRFAIKRTQVCDPAQTPFLQAGMAPGAVRQEPRQGRDQLGWLEQVPKLFLIHRAYLQGKIYFVLVTSRW